MENFLRNYLEAFSYLTYAFAFFFGGHLAGKQWRSRFIVYYLLAAVLMTAASIMENYGMTTPENVFFYNTLYLLTIIFFSWYFLSIAELQYFRKSIIAILTLNLCTAFVYIVLKRGFFQYNTLLFILCFSSLVVYCLLYFSQLTKGVVSGRIVHKFNFWFSSALILYFLSCNFIIIIYDEVPMEYRWKVWSLQNVMLFLSALLLCYGMISMKNGSGLVESEPSVD